MKLKLDENLPASLEEALAALGHEVDTVPAEGLAGRPDGDVWDAAQSEARLLVTQDLDFSDARRYAPGTHHGVLLIRLREPGRVALSDAVRALFEREDVDSWRGCIVVAGDHRIRVRRPEEAGG